MSTIPYHRLVDIIDDTFPSVVYNDPVAKKALEINYSRMTLTFLEFITNTEYCLQWSCSLRNGFLMICDDYGKSYDEHELRRKFATHEVKLSLRSLLVMSEYHAISDLKYYNAFSNVRLVNFNKIHSSYEGTDNALWIHIPLNIDPSALIGNGIVHINGKEYRGSEINAIAELIVLLGFYITTGLCESSSRNRNLSCVSEHFRLTEWWDVAGNRHRNVDQLECIDNLRVNISVELVQLSLKNTIKNLELFKRFCSTSFYDENNAIYGLEFLTPNNTFVEEVFGLVEESIRIANSNGITVYQPSKELYCAICMRNDASTAKVFICKNEQHGFCLECIESWLDINRTCPICRGEPTCKRTHGPEPGLGMLMEFAYRNLNRLNRLNRYENDVADDEDNSEPVSADEDEVVAESVSDSGDESEIYSGPNSISISAINKLYKVCNQVATFVVDSFDLLIACCALLILMCLYYLVWSHDSSDNYSSDNSSQKQRETCLH